MCVLRGVRQKRRRCWEGGTNWFGEREFGKGTQNNSPLAQTTLTHDDRKRNKLGFGVIVLWSLCASASPPPPGQETPRHDSARSGRVATLYLLFQLIPA